MKITARHHPYQCLIPWSCSECIFPFRVSVSCAISPQPWHMLSLRPPCRCWSDLKSRRIQHQADECLQPQQLRIRAMSVTYTTAHGNARSLTHWVRPGIQPASSWILVTREPQRELLRWFLLPFISVSFLNCLPNYHFSGCIIFHHVDTPSFKAIILSLCESIIWIYHKYSLITA